MAQPAPGTIPALPYYQSGALTITGNEIVEIASSQNATSAVSYQMLITDLVGKAPSAMTGALPTTSDLVAFYQVSSNLPKVTTLGNLGVTQGNLPVGGSAGQILNKLSSTNFNSNWSSIVSFVSSDGTSIATSGNATAIVLSVAPAGIGSSQLATGAVLATSIATNAVGNAQFRQSAALSVVGNAGSVTANVADIVGGAGQVLQVNTGGTGLVFSAISSSIFTGVVWAVNQGGIGTAAVVASSLVLGGANNTAPLTTLANATANYVLVGSGTTTAPNFTTVFAGIDFVYNQGGGVLGSGTYGFISLPFNCKINSIAVLGNTSGTVTVDVYKATFASWPTSTSVTAGTGWSLLGTTKFSTTTFSGTTAFNSTDIMQFIATSTIASVSDLTVALQVVKT
jgi:hypothetical protein